MRRAVLVLVVAVLAAAACTETTGDGAADTTQRSPSSVSTPTSTNDLAASTTTTEAPATDATLPICRLQAGDRTVGLFANPALHVLETYGAEHPEEWAGWSAWSDTPGGFRVYVTGRVDVHQAELAARLPADVVVEVLRTDRSSAALQPIADRLNQALGDGGGPVYFRGARPIVGIDRESGERRTLVWVVTERADETTSDRIRSILDAGGRADDAEAVCLAPQVGPIRAVMDQIQDGPGWRLLEEGISGPQGIDVATTEDGYRVLWTRARYQTDRPPVNLAEEVVIYVGGITGSCMDLYLTGVELQTAAGQAADGEPAERIEVVLERPLCGDGGELAIAIPHSYLVAVDRSLLAERVEVAVTNTADPQTATRLIVDLADGDAETDRLGEPRLDLTLIADVTIVPGTEPRAWMVTAERVGPEPGRWLRDVFETGPPGPSGPSAPELDALLAPRVRSDTLPVATSAVTFTVEVCAEGGCRPAGTCELPLDLAPFDHLAVELTITTNGDCRLGALTQVS